MSRSEEGSRSGGDIIMKFKSCRVFCIVYFKKFVNLYQLHASQIQHAS